MNKKLLAWLNLLIAAICYVPALAQSLNEVPIEVKYTLSIDPHFKKRDQYYFELLELAVKKSNVPIELIPVPMPNQVESRDVINLNKNVINIHWMHTSNELESKLIPIHIPLDRGLFGWRLILLNKSNQHLLKDVKAPTDLKEFIFLQGYDWPDTAILIANGFRLETSSTKFQNIFRMLQRKRAYVFPRSVLEIWDEVDEQDGPNVVIDPYILLYYPTACYFFVAKNNKPLASAIEHGLELAVHDGSFDELFARHHAHIIEKIGLKNRRIIRINNPILPPATPLNRKELWLVPKVF